MFCKFKYLFSKLQEKNVKISVFSEKNTIFCGFLSDFGVKTPGKLKVFREMADSEVIVHFLHVIAHNFLSENWGLGREPCTAHGGGRSAKDDEDSAKDG